MNNYARLLKPDEISCRVQQVTDSFGAIILLYKDARTDMNLLDETYGPMNWQREHTEIDDNLFCTIKVWDDTKKQWIAKQDVGVESNMDATKGEASDAFKRAGFNWGIGRELYTGPFIFVQLEDGEHQVGKNGKPQASSRFGLSVKEITYNEAREIKTLVLADRKGRERFTFGKGKTKSAYLPYGPDPDAPKEKPPIKVTMNIDPVEYKRRRDELKSLMQTYDKSNEDYKAIAGDRDIKVMTTQEFDTFKNELTNRWLVS
jgi:hypothetical protein